MTTRQLPHSDEMERAVLGAALLHQDAVYSVLPILRPEDFYNERHKEVYAAMCELVDEGAGVDQITVYQRLESKGAVESCGGAAYVMALTDGLPRAVNVEHYAKAVKDKSTIRQVIRVCHETMQKSWTNEASPEIVTELEKELLAISERRFSRDAESIHEISHRVYRQIEDRAQLRGAMSGVPTGYPSLDSMTGGLQKSDQVIFAARPGMGKTTLAMNVAANACRKGVPSLVFSLEMSRDRLVQRLMCSEGRVDSQRVRLGAMTKEHDWPRINEAMGSLSSYKMWIDDTSAIPILEMRAKARRLVAQHKIGLVVVDYLQLMTAQQQLRRNDNRVQEISHITAGLKAMAKELNVPVVALSQLNRSIESRRGGPQLSDLRESGSIEQDADIVMFLHADGDELENEHPLVDLIVAKHRSGPTGKVSLRWFREHTKFEEDAKREEAA